MRDATPITTPPYLVPGIRGAHPTGLGAGPSPALVQALEQLRSAITHHVGDRRAEGAPLEQVLPEVSALVEHAEILERSPDELGVLLALVRRWSLDAYFDEPALQNVPRFY